MSSNGTLFLIGCGVLGLLVGSFLTVVVDRVPDGRSVVRPRSSCASCQRQLTPRDLIPIASWASQRGRCRHCNDRIGVEPLLIEVVTAVLFVAMGWRFGPHLVVLPFLVLAAALTALSWIDLRDRRLPREISYPAAIVSGLLMLVIAAIDDNWGRVVSALIGAIAATAIMWLIYTVSRGGMGDGDVRISPLLGLHLGYLSLPLVAVGFFLGFVFGAVTGLIAMAFGRATRKTGLPLGPFLALGTLVAVLWGEPMVDAWLGT